MATNPKNPKKPAGPAPRPTLPTAAKSPDKVTKSEAAFAKKYAKIAAVAKQAVDIKGGTTTRAQAAAIKDARAALAEMKKQITKRGYGTLDKTKNKAGGRSSHNIYKDLTGKPLPKKKPRKPKPGGMPPPP